MKTYIVLVALATSLVLAPPPAQAFTCAGKADGQWCHYNKIWICVDGQDVFQDPCLYGCVEGTGPNANCSPPPCTGFCCGKNNGKYCNGNKLVTCTNQATASQQTCTYGCVSAGSNSYCAAPPCSGFCCGKADGEWCHNNEILICDDDEDVFADPCLYGCNEGAGPSADCYPKPCDGYCCGKADGEWCHNDEILICDDDEDVFADPCLYGCNEGDGPDADCSPKPCSGYCCGKADGQWCHNGEIWICDDDEDVFIDPCLGGCDEGDGPDAQCLPPPGFCNGKVDGTWCDGDLIRTCTGGVVTLTTSCFFSCVGDGPGVGCTEDAFCVGKLNGLWCHTGSGDLLECQGGIPVALVDCDDDAGCEEKELGENDVCVEPDQYQPPDGYCQGKPDTSTCWNDVLVVCEGGEAASWSNCPGGCQINWPDAPDVCAEVEIDPQFCADKSWYHCFGEAAVVYCSGGIVAASEECMNGCDEQGEGAPDLCHWEDPALFCSHHTDGAWCNGLYELVNCEAGDAVGVLPCEQGCVKAAYGQADECPGPVGCEGTSYVGSPISVLIGPNCCPTFSGSRVLDVPIFNQLDYSQKMGTCTGKTIANFGCLITSLSMFYEYMGAHRTTQDGTDIPNTPQKENKWRTNNSGYIGCSDDNACCMWYQTWFPAAKNPPGFGGFGETANSPIGECLLSTMAAKVIAAELNSGSPLVAQVTGGSVSEHYVLIVGVNGAGELLLNDPGYGKKARAFSANTGFGAYGVLPSVYYLGGIGMGGGVPPWYQEPVLPEGLEDEVTGGTVLTQEGEASLGHLFEPVVEPAGEGDTPDSDSSGCTAGPIGASSLLLLGLLLLMLFRSRRVWFS